MVGDFRETKVYQEAFEDGFQQGLKEGFSDGMKLGTKAGLKQAAKMIARRLLVAGENARLIEEVTGLSLAEIRRLQRKRGRSK